MAFRFRTLTALEAAGGLAFVWALAFGALSFVWAAGGMIGVGQLSPTLQEQSELRETGFVAVLWITGVVKVVGGLVPLALTFGLWPGISRRLFVASTWLGGVLLTLYGLADILSGAVRAATDNDDNAIWYAVLWGPIWLVGGVLYLATAWAYRQANHRRA